MTRHRLMLSAFVTAVLATLSANSAWATDANWAEKMFGALSHDFGKVARGADVSHRIKITNIYKEACHISSVRTTCGCSAATPSKTTLGSLEECYIEVTLDTRKFKHEKKSNVIVTFDAPLYAEVRIPIQAYIRSDVVLTPGSAEFGSVELGGSATKTIDVAYAGRNDWTLRDVKTASDYLSTKITEVSRNDGRVNYRLELTIGPNAPAGSLREQVMLVTDDVNPYVPMMVTANVESDITVATPAVALGAVPAGQAKPFSVIIRGKKPFEIAKIECESDRGCFKVRLPEEPKVVHVIPMTFNAPTEAGTVTEEFTVTVDGRDEPLKFTATGTVMGGTF